MQDADEPRAAADASHEHFDDAILNSYHKENIFDPANDNEAARVKHDNENELSLFFLDTCTFRNDISMNATCHLREVHATAPVLLTAGITTIAEIATFPGMISMF
jgi:hypothetical protein